MGRGNTLPRVCFQHGRGTIECRGGQPRTLTDILSIFCDIDDFCSRFEPVWRQHLSAPAGKKRHRPSSLALSEVMTILVLCHGLH
jgi:hypothetical protein